MGHALKTIAALLVLGGIAPVAVLTGCPSDEPGGSGGVGGGAASGGAAGASGSSGAAGNTWDPVWHETKPKNWTSYPPDNLPDCGSGCRIAMNVPLRNPATRGHSFTASRFVSETNKGIGFTSVGSDITLAIRRVDEALLQPFVYGDHVSYLRSFGVADGQVEVASLITGETKIAFRYTPEEAGKNSVWRTVLGPRHVLWLFPGGIWARNLQTGEVKNLGGECFTYCPTEDKMLCDAGRIYLIDQDTGEKEYLDYGGSWQTHGTCSPKRTQYAWIDYRDPPGVGSTSFNRSGGEVYVHDLTTKKTKRVTFDSPGSPRGKVYPAVDGDLVVWNEPADPDPANPPSMGELIGASKSLVKFDRKTGQRCRLTSRNFFQSFKSLHGTHVYGSWFDLPSSEVWLADLDLEHPSLTWDCVPTPEWKP